MKAVSERTKNLPTLPTLAEWWEAVRWVLLIFTIIIAVTLAGSFVSYERVVESGHPWLPRTVCAGCPFCGMTRSFCALSSGHWREGVEWNRAGPVLYAAGWLWLMLCAMFSVRRLNEKVRR